MLLLIVWGGALARCCLPHHFLDINGDLYLYMWIITGGCVPLPIHESSKAWTHIGIGPFVKPGELIISYGVILFSSHAFHFATIK